MQATNRLVWDLPLRLFHWLFALSIFASWGTAQLGFKWMQWHIWLGYWVIGLVAFRLIWGFVGPKHARFSNFLKGPSAIFRYVRGFAGVGAPLRSVGHNPLGGLMVILMLLLVAFQEYTGLFATDDIAWAGPYNGAISGSVASTLTSLHHVISNCILAAIGLHLTAIAYYAFVKGENLVPAMLTGRKRAEAVPAGEAIASSELWKASIVIAASAGVVLWVVLGAPSASNSNF
jgi:cytochrome b